MTTFNKLLFVATMCLMIAIIIDRKCEAQDNPAEYLTVLKSIRV